MSVERIVKGKPHVQPVNIATDTLRVPLVLSGRLRRVYVKKTGGTAVSFIVTVYDKFASPGDINRVYKYDTAGTGDTSLCDQLTDIAFRNEDGIAELDVKIVSSAAADNDYEIRLDAVEGSEHAGD